MFTSRSEFRLMLRPDNADSRLSKIAQNLGILDDEYSNMVEYKRAEWKKSMDALKSYSFSPKKWIEHGINKECKFYLAIYL